MKISNNFKMEEFAVSANYPNLVKQVPKELESNIINLVLKLLQPICNATGWRDYISSGYRSPELNKAVKGAPNSQHMKGEACDNNFTYNGIHVSSYEVLKKVVELNLDFDQIVIYPTFVHLSYTTKRKNRKQIVYNKSYTGRRL